MLRSTMQSLMTCLVAGSQYLIHPHKLGAIQETINPDAILPVTLLETHEIFGDLEVTLRLFALYDDVFVPEFGAVIVEKPGSSSTLHQGDAPRPPNKDFYHLDGEASVMAGVAQLPSGPYFLHGPNLHQAWKLYDDEYGAFVSGVIPENVTVTDEFRVITSLSETGTHRGIPVPSRLYHRAPNSRKPLSGIRMAIPDAMSLKGVRTTLSSRAWRLLQTGPVDATATLAQRLLDLGAIVVGNTKSSQFGAGREWVDEEAPWNPREDAYQSPRGGAAGAATAMAGYDWLKTTFGFDGIGGLRDTAAAHGLYSLRTTPGAISVAGSQTSSHTYDTVGLFSRDILELFNIASAVLNQSHSDTATTLPKRLLCPVDFFESDGSNRPEELIVNFITTLETFLGIKTEEVNVAATWKKHPPPEATGRSLHEYMRDAAFLSFCYEFYHEYDGFRKAAQDQLGYPPYLEATTKYQWNAGKEVTKEDYDEYLQRIKVFRQWFSDKITCVGESDGAWVAVILPFHSAAPMYRDHSLSAQTRPHGLTAELLPSILQTPQFVVPFAQLPYNSRVSDRQEYHPVYASVMGPKSGDLRIVHLVRRAFETARWRTRVDTGRFAFPLAENSRHVNDSHVPDNGARSEGIGTIAEAWGEL